MDTHAPAQIEPRDEAPAQEPAERVLVLSRRQAQELERTLAVAVTNIKRGLVNTSLLSPRAARMFERKDDLSGILDALRRPEAK